jgi:hypothetical protein
MTDPLQTVGGNLEALVPYIQSLGQPLTDPRITIG